MNEPVKKHSIVDEMGDHFNASLRPILHEEINSPTATTPGQHNIFKECLGGWMHKANYHRAKRETSLTIFFPQWNRIMRSPWSASSGYARTTHRN
jgi:hypothetical protein